MGRFIGIAAGEERDLSVAGIKLSDVAVARVPTSTTMPLTLLAPKSKWQVVRFAKIKCKMRRLKSRISSFGFAKSVA